MQTFAPTAPVTYDTPAAAIALNTRVDFQRPGYSFRDGVVLALVSLDRALVQWTDESGETRQSVCGAEFLHAAARDADALAGMG